MTKHISSWSTYVSGTFSQIEKALEKGEINKNDTVWTGSDGSVIIGDAEDAHEAEEANGTEYNDSGTVEEFLSQPE